MDEYKKLMVKIRDLYHLEEELDEAYFTPVDAPYKERLALKIDRVKVFHARADAKLRVIELWLDMSYADRVAANAWFKDVYSVDKDTAGAVPPRLADGFFHDAEHDTYRVVVRLDDQHFVVVKLFGDNQPASIKVWKGESITTMSFWNTTFFEPDAELAAALSERAFAAISDGMRALYIGLLT